MDSIIDTALASVAGTVAKDLEPAAVATLQDLKTFVHGQADRLRTALPVLEEKALAHVRSISAAVLGEYDNVLARIDSHLAGNPAPAVVESNAGSAAVAPVDPTAAAPAPQDTPIGSSTSSTPPSTDSASTDTPAV
jgi:hypothetical protein